MPQLGICKTCQWSVSLEANSCPKCGQPNPSVDILTDAVYSGTVKEILHFGAIVQLQGGPEGLVHVSQLAANAGSSDSKNLRIGDEVKVKVLVIDNSPGNKVRISLSMRDM